VRLGLAVVRASRLAVSRVYWVFMATLESSAAPSRALPAAMSRVAAALMPAAYATTLLVSALLLFAVQPMFTKMVLPLLGGAPSVWSVAMVFFQTALLAGYLYAHLLTRAFSPSRAALVHLLLLAAAACALPIGIAAGFSNPPEEWIGLWVFALFGASIGLPLVALSATAPMLQSWFAASGHPQSGNPYVLYAASNLGSFVGLLAYPFVIEPLFPLHEQARLWSGGFALLTILLAIAGLLVARSAGTSAGEARADEGRSPSIVERLTWIALAAIPSGLVIAVTAHVTTDIAAAPFLWVIPLALYLLTFVAVFREQPWFPPPAVVRAVPLIIAPLSITVLGGADTFWLAMIALNLCGFVALTLLCHGRLYARRPDPRHLTEFYLYVSLGGVVGGMFAGLLAPHLFNGTYEYPILICAALLVLPGVLGAPRAQIWRDIAPALTLVGAVLVTRFVFTVPISLAARLPFQLGLGALALWMLLAWRRPARLVSLAMLTFLIGGLWQSVNQVELARSFFGVHQVADTADGTHRFLIHGTTIHGVEAVRAADGALLGGRPEPLSYYYAGGPFSEGIAAARRAQGRLRQVAAVGLGTGSVACYAQRGETWTFFEIDLEVARIARDPRLFHFLARCAPDVSIVLGDARLKLLSSVDFYDLIMLDAFSSDVVPVHLLTREAISGYVARLTPHGTIVMQISNRHMDLAPFVAATARAEGLFAIHRQDDIPNNFLTDYRAVASVVVLARSPSDFGDLPQQKGWQLLAAEAKTRAWTDDYSDVLGAILRRKLVF
jgi:spermidine synthase